ncbi:MAG: VWA domain-containing protein [Planctomycetes bacterium]|nr:VWA domain-containing protein [Planctomycetota bacterium]HPY75482.1 VWA domain-containing protein [Planctomycetota bacterium]HQB00322.1 VWA domain-containing protein [Planctomycetota bacterium]
MIFVHPYAFLLLLLIPLWLYSKNRQKQTAALLFTDTSELQTLPKSIRQKTIWIPTFLRVLAYIFLIIALARPQIGMEKIHTIDHGIAIYAVIDRSTSMQAQMKYKNRSYNRLEIVKDIFQQFIHGNGYDLQGRPNDLIGLIQFARYADTVCPLTHSHSTLSEYMKFLQIVDQEDEDGTAIGDALALALARLQTAEQTQNSKKSNYTIKSKIIILLTDGEQNCGQRTIDDIIPIAKKWNIKIYTIGIGGGENYVIVNTPFGQQKIPVQARFNEEILKKLAHETNAIYRSANNSQTLLNIYHEIDNLEKSEVESIYYSDTKEIFVPYALIAFICLYIEALLTNTLYRRLP